MHKRDPRNFVGRRDARYKDDVYDRIWSCDQYLYKTLDWYPMGLDESINMDNATNDAYKLPAHVLKSAVQPRNVSRTLGFVYTAYSSTVPLGKSYYVYFHFNEIEKLSDGKKRKINITFKNQPVPSKPIVLDYLKPVTLNFKTQDDVLFNISATSDSDAPPLLNAFEIYKLITQLDSPTYAQDGTYNTYTVPSRMKSSCMWLQIYSIHINFTTTLFAYISIRIDYIRFQITMA